MFESFKNRMTIKGSNISEALRLQSNMVIEQTWDRDPHYRQVYVVRVNRGLPEITVKHELVDVKFNVDTYQNINSDEPAYHLQFRHGAEKINSDIAIGSYIYMKDEDGEWKWWMLVGFDERPEFRQYHILECNWKFGWVVAGRIYYQLGIWRNGSSNREADVNSYTATVNGNGVIWMPTNADTLTIGHDQRFLISDAGRVPPLCYSVSTIKDTLPMGITKFVVSQTTFDKDHDNAELMLANYDDREIEPVESTKEMSAEEFLITYNGINPVVKIGGSEKVLTAQLSSDNYFDIKWIISDGKQTYDCTYENKTWIFGDYTVVTYDRQIKLKVANNYDLIGTILTIEAKCADGSYGKLQVEVVG